MIFAMPSRKVVICSIYLLSVVLFISGILTPIIRFEFDQFDFIRSVLGGSIANFSDQEISQAMKKASYAFGGSGDIVDISSSQTETVISGIRKLFVQGDTTPALIVLIFSVIFPIFKFIIILVAFFSKFSFRKTNYTLSKVHKFAMVDVFALAIVVIMTSSKNFFSTEFMGGFYCFVGYVVMMQIMFFLMRPYQTQPGLQSD
jgi:hypothetical protein